MLRHLCLAAALVTLLPAARADDPCAAEVEKWCPRGRGEFLVVACLRQHEAELSTACKGDLDAVLAKAKVIGAACEGDVYRLCKDVEPGEGRVAACLKNRESELSQSCQGAFNAWRVARMEFQAACAGDIGQLCQMVPQGSGRLWVCLREQTTKLSSKCRAALEKL
jgi:hypothetical protein